MYIIYIYICNDWVLTSFRALRGWGCGPMHSAWIGQLDLKRRLSGLQHAGVPESRRSGNDISLEFWCLGEVVFYILYENIHRERERGRKRPTLFSCIFVRRAWSLPWFFGASIVQLRQRSRCLKGLVPQWSPCHQLGQLGIQKNHLWRRFRCVNLTLGAQGVSAEDGRNWFLRFLFYWTDELLKSLNSDDILDVFIAGISLINMLQPTSYSEAWEKGPRRCCFCVLQDYSLPNHSDQSLRLLWDCQGH